MTKKIPLLLIFFILLTTACTRKVYIPVERTVTTLDSAYIRSTDSLRRLLTTRDTLIIRDSIATYIHGDTVIKEAWRYRDRVSIIRDTIRDGTIFKAEKLRRDNTAQTVLKTPPEDTPRPLTLWQKTTQTLGIIFITGAILAAAWTLMRRRIRRKTE